MSREPIVALIAAIAENGVIGNGNKMPWRLSTDFRHFKQTTMGKPLVMGRKTFQSIGRPLPGRHTIVVSRDADFRAEGVDVVPDLETGLRSAADWARRHDVDEVFVAGGGEIYRQAMPHAERAYLTLVHAKPEGDTSFPEMDKADWRLANALFVPAGPDDTADMTFRVFVRVVDA